MQSAEVWVQAVRRRRIGSLLQGQCEPGIVSGAQEAQLRAELLREGGDVAAVLGREQEGRDELDAAHG